MTWPLLLAGALDRGAFARACGLEPDARQAMLLRSRARRLAVCTSRQWGKSTTASVLGAADAYYGAPLTLIVSPTQRQSDETFAKLQRYLAAALEGESVATVQREGAPAAVHERRVGAGRRVTAAELADEWKVRSLVLRNGARVVSLPGAPENIRGFSAASRVIVDEASFVVEALFAAVRPMLLVSRGSLVLLSTPNGKQGEFYRVMTSGDDAWERHRVTWRENPRIDAADVEQDRRELPAWLFAQEYECEFTETLGAVFQARDIEAAVDEREAAWAV